MPLKLLPIIISLFCWHAGSASVSSTIREIESSLELSIVLETGFKSTWTVDYVAASDSNELLSYLNLLKYEYGKYPAGYFRRIGINHLALGKYLKLIKQKRAAIPDPQKHTLFLDIDSALGKEYLSYVMHHDLNHCAEYAVWNDMYYHWKRWTRKNPCKFRYGKGGATAYDNMQVNWRELNHPSRGFVNLYATTGEEEDRAEIVALLMSDSAYNTLIKFTRSDRKLKRKMKLAIKFLNRTSGTRKNYWRRRGKTPVKTLAEGCGNDR